MTTTTCTCAAEFGDRVINVGRTHYGVCEACRCYWWAGSNLFSIPAEMTPAEMTASITKSITELASYSKRRKQVEAMPEICDTPETEILF